MGTETLIEMQLGEVSAATSRCGFFMFCRVPSIHVRLIGHCDWSVGVNVRQSGRLSLFGSAMDWRLIHGVTLPWLDAS